ncbi:MAG TPA: hypothetical protein VMB85_18680 [Bryobacteraceae bacterium]|jgi:hypothetical protein|nr:hypothetical protein [Bryobacteraceae bacterium]
MTNHTQPAAEGLAVARKTGRLTPADTSAQLAPWRRAHQLTRCSLYWIPVKAFPMPLTQKTWLLRFLDRLASTLLEEFQLRREIFLQYKTVVEVAEAFQRTSLEFMPNLGLSRRPGAAVRGPATVEELKEFKESGKEFNLNDYVPDYCYWFLKKSGAKQLETFWGHGGISMIFIKPDPATSPPPLPFSAAFREKSRIFKAMDVDGIWESAFALSDGFQAKSKELFGAGLENGPYSGIRFILPVLQSSDFFIQPEPEFAKWFQVFDLYIRESPEDAGVLLASKSDLDETLIALLEKMREDGLAYPDAR